MSAISYYSAIRKAAELAPLVSTPGGSPRFIAWAEDTCEILSSIYLDMSYDNVTKDLYNEVRELQDIEDED